MNLHCEHVPEKRNAHWQKLTLSALAPRARKGKHRCCALDFGLAFPSQRFRAACRDDRLRQEIITPDTPEQNGIIERFFRSLRAECVWLHRFASFAEAKRAIAL
jgi:transposase InsO family protein